MESSSIMVSAITIYCGLFFMSSNLNEGAKIVLFVIMVVTNAIFLVNWLRRMISAGLEIAYDKVSCLKRCFKRGVRDGFEEDILVSTNHNFGVIK